MSIQRQAVTDGITSQRRTLITGPLDEEDFDAYVREHNREWDRCGTFDGRVANLEQLCRGHCDAWWAMQAPGGSISLDFGSREWYAQEILMMIAEVRDALEHGNWQRATSDAVAVGVLAAEAEAKHDWPIVQLGLKRKRDTRTSGTSKRPA